jgi:hypothetical protein
MDTGNQLEIQWKSAGNNMNGKTPAGAGWARGCGSISSHIIAGIWYYTCDRCQLDAIEGSDWPSHLTQVDMVM